jgi:casein kinase II subunit alpha
MRDIKIVDFVDSGRFSNVFEASLDPANEKETNNDAIYWSGSPTRGVLKVLKHTFSGKVKREIRILELLRDVRGVVRLLGVSRNGACFPKTIGLLFEHLPGTQWLSHMHLAPPSRALPPTTNATASTSARTPSDSVVALEPPPPWTLDEIRLFVYKLLDALRECHLRGVMHRDVKPRNVIVQRGGPAASLTQRQQQLRLIDFGLSELYAPGAKYNPSVASRHYKCPELLLGYCYYDYGVDVWAAGCMLAGLVFNIEPFFYGADLLDQLGAVSAVVGSRSLLDWAARHRLRISPAQRRAIGKHPAVPLDRFRSAANSHLCCGEAIDLLGKMLCVDHQQRATAEECLSHPFFDPVRVQILSRR